MNTITQQAGPINTHAGDRWQRALARAQESGVQVYRSYTDRDRWIAVSQSAPTCYYSVSLDPLVCECDGSQYGPCKHLAKVAHEAGMLRQLRDVVEVCDTHCGTCGVYGPAYRVVGTPARSPLYCRQCAQEVTA